MHKSCPVWAWAASTTAGASGSRDIENHSHYSANSIGGSYGLSPGPTSDKAVGPASVPGAGGAVPMIAQNESGDQSATTRSAISAGTINVTDGAHQTQDIASLSRDTTNTNGTVSKAPDVNDILNKQADTMQAAQAAGQTVSQGIGAYADMKRDDALKTAQAAYDRGDLAGASAALADFDSWAEGGTHRIALHVAGGALIGGLGGGSAFSTIGGAAGAGLASTMAGSLNEISKGVASATGSDLVGNLAANIAAGVGGAAVGGTAGAAMGSNVHLYNQSVDDERALTGDPGTKSPSLFSLAMQGIANGLSAIVGMGGGGPPASPGMAMAGSVAGGATTAALGSAGYVPDNATLASGGNNNRLPIPDTVTADNGLQVESNPKHTAGMPGNNPSAGTEPADSLSLFNSSVSGGDGVRYAIDSNGNINRFYEDGNGVYHWSGSTGDTSAPLNVSKIPINIKRTLGFKGK